MLKTISIVLPEKMIAQIDAMLLEKDFTSRSDFFRHLVRTWFAGIEVKTPEPKEKDVDELIDLEYGIPKGVIKKIEEQAGRIT